MSSKKSIIQGIVHWSKYIVLYWKIDTHSLIRYLLSSQNIIFFTIFVKVCFFLWIFTAGIMPTKTIHHFGFYKVWKQRLASVKLMFCGAIIHTLPVWRCKSFSVKVTKQAMLVWDLKPFSDMAASQKPAESWLCG